MIIIFKKGQGISENTSQLDKLYQIIQGQVEIRIDGTILQLSPGQAIIIPANTFVQIKATNRCKMIQTIVESDYAESSHLN